VQASVSLVPLIDGIPFDDELQRVLLAARMLGATAGGPPVNAETLLAAIGLARPWLAQHLQGRPRFAGLLDDHKPLALAKLALTHPLEQLEPSELGILELYTDAARKLLEFASSFDGREVGTALGVDDVVRAFVFARATKSQRGELSGLPSEAAVHVRPPESPLVAEVHAAQSPGGSLFATLAATSSWDARSPEHRTLDALRALDRSALPPDAANADLRRHAWACVEARGGDRLEAGDLIAAQIFISGIAASLLLEHLLDTLDPVAAAYLSKRLRSLGISVPSGVMVSDYTADTVAGHAPDLIGGVEREATAFARVCLSKQIHPPLAIGVFGQWGAGKSYFMEKVHSAVEQVCDSHRERNPLFHGHVVQIRFNAWHYIETNLWASLVEHIFTELDDWLRKEDNGIEASDIDRLFERLSTSRLLKLEAVDELVARRRRKAEAALVVLDERVGFREAMRKQQEQHQREFPWPAVIKALDDDPQWPKAELADAGDTLGIDHMHESGNKLSAVLQQSVDAGGRTRLMISALAARFGRTWPLFVLVVLVASFVPFLATGRLVGWDTIQSAAVSACTVIAALAAMVGEGLRAADSAIERIERARGRFEQQIETERERLRHHLTHAEDKLAEAAAAVTRAEDHLSHAEREVANAAEAFNWGSARGRLNRFIRDKVTSGDYARHLGLITSIRRDFVELARLMQSVETDDNSNDHEAREFEANYARRVEDTIVRVVSEYCRRDPSGAVEYRTAVETLIGKPIKLPICPPEPTSPAASSSIQAAGPALDLIPEPLLTLEELRRLWTGLGAREDIPPAFERIILYVDDLDRCPPQKVVEVLQAAHLLLGFRLFVVLIAVDERWVSRALARHYKEMLADPSEGEHDGAATSHDYLEKIFQIPYWVRPMESQASEKFIGGLIGMGSNAVARELASLDEPARTKPVQQAIGPASRSAASAPTPGRKRPESASSRAADQSAPPRAASAHDQPQQVEPVEPSPTDPPEYEARAMVIETHEREFMIRLAPFAGDSPRRGKRFVNAYRLVKAGLRPSVLGTFVGADGKAQDYRALLVQLAISTGAPLCAGAYFEALARTLDYAAVRTAIESTRGPDALDRLRVLGALDLAEQSGLTPAALARWSSLARRYSFVPRS
jgi:hypothetical protein